MRGRILPATLIAGISICSIGQSDAATLWDQSDFQTVTSAGTSVFLPVNDFQLVQAVQITAFSVWLSDAADLQGGDELANGIFTSFSGGLSWYFFVDNAGLPGLLIDSGFDAAPTVADTGVNRTGTFVDDIFRVDGAVAPGLFLTPGTYWFGVREGMPGSAADGTDILWLAANGVIGEFAKLFLDGQNIANLNEAPGGDLAFVLQGNVPEPSSGILFLIGALACGALGVRSRMIRRRRPVR